jgi:DNA mismatch repair protein MutL
MSSKIRILSDHTINKIAAGEVIENPASVIKELTENSIDAGATDICIEIQGGGRQMIRISDNGCGMNSDDALLCLERHATSKLRNVEDIHSLMTMGFRGEAIPSIASISKFNLLTCPFQETNLSTQGTMVIVDGGKIVSCHPAARSQGTTIEVKSLFFNVPVRKKFLKSPTIDTNEILKIVSLMSLGYPEIKFQLVSDGKNLLMASPSKDLTFSKRLEERIENVLGSDFRQNTVYIEDRKEGLQLCGVIGSPGYSRHNRTGQYLFINKRAVVSPLVAFAVKEGFGTAIPTGRFPVFVLHLNIPGDLVDVNVHPQKREVRLRQEQLIKEIITKSVRNGIGSENIPFLEAKKSENIPTFFNWTKNTSQEVPETWIFQPKSFEISPAIISKIDTPSYGNHESLIKKNQEATIIPPVCSLPLTVDNESSLKALATIPSYIIVDGTSNQSFLQKGFKNPEKGGILIIDQKNAHARVLFEKLSQTQANSSIVLQALLIPYTIELTVHESASLRIAMPTLNKMGIHIREFGSNTFLIDAIPQLFGNSNLDVFISDIIHSLHKLQLDSIDEQLIRQEHAKQIVQAANRASVSFHQRLSLMEAQSLLDQLMTCKQPYVCPAGKPILSRITTDDLAKLFQK